MESQNDVPALRFPNFEEDWNRGNLANLGVSIIDGDRGTNYPNGSDFSNEGYCLFLNAKNVTKNGFSFNEKSFITKAKDEVLRKGKLKRWDIVLTTRGSIGYFALYDMSVPFEHLRINSGMVLVRIENKLITPQFLYRYFNSNKVLAEIDKISFGSAQPQLTVGELSKLKICFPSLVEQQKIASFLTALDEKLLALKKKKGLLEEYKKGVMQKLFLQKQRFQDDQGRDFPDWEEKQLSDVADRVTTKNKVNNLNVLTISAQEGLISQLEYFSKSVSAKNVTGYYLLHTDDFAYNKSYSNGYPMGAIKRLKKYESGVVSTLYICFRLKRNISVDFFEHYFNSGLQNEEIEKVAQEGIRNHGLLNVGIQDFFGIDVSFPSLDEQIKIANFLTALDEKIDNCNTQILKTETWKKGLLQKMFI